MGHVTATTYDYMGNAIYEYQGQMIPGQIVASSPVWNFSSIPSTAGNWDVFKFNGPAKKVKLGTSLPADPNAMVGARWEALGNGHEPGHKHNLHQRREKNGRSAPVVPPAANHGHNLR